MSDGPHRSLNMRPGWKKVAEFADMPASDAEDVAARRDAALRADWKMDVPELLVRGLRDILGGEADSLFADQKVDQLKALRRLAPGHGLSQLVLDCAIHQSISGSQGRDTLVEAVAEALSVWCSRHARQIEEDYQRKTTEARGRNVRERIESGVCSDTHTRLARQLLGLDGGTAPRNPPKRTALDDGVRI